jgi:uncharacterized protein with HEPN domain
MLHDIRAAVGFIIDDTAGISFETFVEDRRVRQAVERNVEIIGEAMNRLSRHDPETLARISDYARIIAFRNLLIHRYDEIDYPAVWHVIQTSLPVLHAEIEALFHEFEP